MAACLHRRAVLACGFAAGVAGAARADDDGLTRVRLKTGEGEIVLALETAKAPVTVGNFLHYVDARRFDHASFYRVSHAPEDPNFGLVQGGVKGDPARLFKPIAHESTAKTGLAHKDGTISMARGRPGTANAEFFICIGDHPGFDAGGPGGDADGFAAFGHVETGMDVVRVIFGLPTSPTAGVGALRGQMLSPPVPIMAARRA